MKDYSEILGVLPERIENHVKNDKGRLAFRSLFSDPLFIVREETDNDYGVDICIEALVNDGKSPTNIRTQVQLKSSGKKTNTDGGYSYPVAVSNLNYLVNHQCSFYAFYSLNEDKFYYHYADKVYLLHNSNRSKKNKSITINFCEELNYDTIKLIHQNLIDTTILFKDIRIKLHEGGFKPGAKLVYGELVFESSSEHFEEYLSKNNLAYAYTTDENGKIVFMHNLIWESHHGQIPRGYQVYHVNRNTMDNQSDNLDIMRTIDNFDIEGFQKETEESQARNIMSVILEGRNAELTDVPTPPGTMFYKIVKELEETGWSASSKDITSIKRDMKRHLGMEFE